MLDANLNSADWSSMLRGMISSLQSKVSAMENGEDDDEFKSLKSDLEAFNRILNMAIGGNIGAGSVTGGGSVEADTIIGGDVLDIHAPNATFIVGDGDTLREEHSNVEQAYLQWVFSTTRRLSLGGIDPRHADARRRPSEMTLDSVYVALDTLPSDKVKLGNENHAVAAEPNGNDGSDARLPLLELLRHNRRLVLLGDPGSGKSSFINYLALCLSGARLQPESDWLQRVGPLASSASNGRAGWSQGVLLPVQVTLRNFAASLPADIKTASADRLWTFIKAELSKYELTDYTRHLLEALRRGRCIVLLDGLDEIPSKARRRLVRDAVADFTHNHPLNRFVVTCRTLSYSERAWQLDDFPTAKLAPLDSKQIDMFINAWYRTLAQQGRIPPETAEAKSVELSSAARYMNDLAENPMLLTTMALVHTFLGTLPYERARLYDECVNLLMWRWPQTKYVASGEWEPGIANQLGTRDDRLITALHNLAWNAHSRQGEREGAADMPEKEVLNVLKSFLTDSWGKAQTFCEYIEERTGLLVGRGIRRLTNEEGEEVEETIYAFPHRTIQEFLAGCYLASQRKFSRRVQKLARKGDVWREVVLLAAGHLVFNQTDSAKPLDAVNVLCSKELPTNKIGWRSVWWAGDILSLVGSEAAAQDEIGRRVLPRVRRQLVALLEGGHLSPAQRVEAADALGRLGDPRKGVCSEYPDTVRVASGKFEMGSGDERHEVSLRPFKMARYPVTNAQFWNFIDGGGYEERRYWTAEGWDWRMRAGDDLAGFASDLRWDIANRPVVGINWYEAHAYANWLSEQSGKHYRLPSEAEWERAAAGRDGRRYPWGNRWKDDRANTQEAGVGRTAPVGSFPADATPKGIQDMGGNIWEWTLSKSQPYPYNSDDGREETAGHYERVLRGGACYNSKLLARCTYRNWLAPDSRVAYIGFRLVEQATPPALPAPSE